MLHKTLVQNYGSEHEYTQYLLGLANMILFHIFVSLDVAWQQFAQTVAEKMEKITK